MQVAPKRSALSSGLSTVTSGSIGELGYKYRTPDWGLKGEQDPAFQTNREKKATKIISLRRHARTTCHDPANEPLGGLSAGILRYPLSCPLPAARDGEGAERNPKAEGRGDDDREILLIECQDRVSVIGFVHIF